MEIVFDPAKDGANLQKHGVSLVLGRATLENRIADLPARDVHGEPRRIAFGLVNGRLLVCVYVTRDDICRVISVRPASRQERRKWWR